MDRPTFGVTHPVRKIENVMFSSPVAESKERSYRISFPVHTTPTGIHRFVDPNQTFRESQRPYDENTDHSMHLVMSAANFVVEYQSSCQS